MHPHLRLLAICLMVLGPAVASAGWQVISAEPGKRVEVDVIDGLPFVTVQSLIENLDEDAPGRAAAAHAVVRIDERRTVVPKEKIPPIVKQAFVDAAVGDAPSDAPSAPSRVDAPTVTLPRPRSWSSTNQIMSPGRLL